MAITYVRSLRTVADDLHRTLNLLTGPKRYKGTPEEIVRITGYSASMVILRALAAEIVLKALCFKRTGRYKRIHDLHRLFRSLDSKTKAIITKLENSHGIAPVEKILKKHKHDFLEWRYLINDGNLQVDFLDLDNALRILLVVYAHKDFLDLCAAGPKQRSRRWMNWPGVAWRSLQDALGRCLTRTTRQRTHGR